MMIGYYSKLVVIVYGFLQKKTAFDSAQILKNVIAVAQSITLDNLTLNLADNYRLHQLRKQCSFTH